MPQKKNKKIGFLTRIFLCGFAVYAVVTLISLRVQINERNRENDALKQAITEQEMSNAQIKETLDKGVTDEAIADSARDDLGYVMPGERVFVDTASN